MLKTGIIGAIVTALCCFTPVLVVAYGALVLLMFVVLGIAGGIGPP